MERKTLPFSSLGRILTCPGSIDLIRELGRPDVDNDDARLDGIRANRYAEDYLSTNLDSLDIDMEGVTEEMMDAVECYTDDVLQIARLTGATPIVEGELVAKPIDKEGRVRGRADCWLFDSANNTIYVWDFKYGRRKVDAYESWQLIAAAAGALYNTNHRPGCKIVMRIVQPRCYRYEGPVDIWITSKESLEPKFREAQSIVNYIFDDEKLLKTCTPSKYCSSCPAAHGCPALHNTALNIIDFVDDNVPTFLKDNSLAWFLSQCEIAEKRLQSILDGLRTEALYRVEHGTAIPGYHLKSGYSHARWIISDAEVLALGELAGVDLSDNGVKTPAQAKKAGIPDDLVGSMSKRYPTEAKLVADGNMYHKLTFGD